VDDYFVQLLISGTPTGDDKGVGTPINLDTERSDTYGGSSDTWGNALTPAIVNSSTFGFVFAAEENRGQGDNTLYVDSLGMTVYYTISWDNKQRIILL